MRTVKLKLSIFAFITIWLFISGCKKESICDNCEKATLYYTSGCSTIKGYVKLSKNKEIFVFQHDISPEFRSSEIKVRITYEIEGDKVLTADCAMGKVIKITCIEKR